MAGELQLDGDWPYPFSPEDASEDWPKSGTFDFWNHDGTQVSTFDDMFPGTPIPPRQSDVDRIRQLTRLPLWLAAPAGLRRDTARFLMSYDYQDAPRSKETAVDIFGEPYSGE